MIEKTILANLANLSRPPLPRAYLKTGADAYKGEQFPSGPYAKVGDWVIFPRGSSLQSKYEDEPIIMVEDFKIKLIVEDPSKVSR